MHILFFTYDVPYPPNSGGKTRALNLLKYSGKDITYSLFSFTRPGFDLADLEELKKIGIATIELFPRKSVKNMGSLKALLSKKSSVFSSLYFDQNIETTLQEYVKEKNVDLVHFESFYTGFYISENLKTAGVKQVYGSENIEYKLYEEMVPRFPQVLRSFFRREVEKVRLEELEMVKRSDAALAVTKNEARYFENETGKHVQVIENGVAIENFPKISLKNTTPLTLLFIGNFSYFPNVDGLTHFYRDIFAKLDRRTFHLVVVGKGVTKLSFLDNSVEKIEYIPDVYDAYAMADVFVSPIRIGGGTNFKVLEAMAAGLPVVAYLDKTGDMGFRNEHDILQARNTDEFISYLRRLSEKSVFREALGKHAREIVARLYDWKTIGEKLNKIWKKTYETN